ncbi:Taurine catabolism dioxygenase [Colletotrichum higginsianum IMI 349063]|uniref:Taurine catabolism dioxygenase n=1 Tax=Colletotrichum higginsianum (strain IMI 349063) TaxID=759273 RepID=A0A1B7XYM5_COLHI|nr:Taurine catabolism dioxygenase [Colletotrichum higginsianum IMI 349063]OBR04849.1 Taurine catabolism dioxygenase [Colletotrichum higginsianum IMI 349063]
MGSISEALRPAPYGPAVHLPAPYPEKTEFPLSLAASHQNTHVAALVAEVEELSSSGKLRVLLDKHGAVYFQNLGLESAEQFSQFAHAFGWTAHEDIGNPVRRTIHAKNVATANEGPNTQPVYPHNEFGLSPHSRRMYSSTAHRRQRLGVKYQLFYPNGPRDQTSSAGTTLLQAYGGKVSDSDDTETARAKIETEVKRLATAQWVWENQSDSNPLGDLRVWQHLPGDTAFFNNVVSRFLNAIDADTLQPPHINKDGKYQPPAFYGDGSLIPREFLDSAVEIIKSVNHVVQHGREPWTG